MSHKARKLAGTLGALVLVTHTVATTSAAELKGLRLEFSAQADAVPPAAADAMGLVEIDITDILGRDLAARVNLRPDGEGKTLTVEVPEGRAQADCPTGAYRAFIHVYSEGVPFLVGVKDIVVRQEKSAFLAFNLLEGTHDNARVAAFDQDRDLAIDSVELRAGTDPADPASIPGCTPLPWKDTLLSQEQRWYRGELHAWSVYGKGKQTVADLVKRAKKEQLDFLAITDRNTMEACFDPAFQSDSVVLIPAMEWGDEERGIALFYGPRTFPAPARTAAEAEAVAVLVQAQGGVFAIAHPCFPNAPWQWGFSNANAVEVWCRGWRDAPPMWLDLLNQDMRTQRDGRLVHSVALAADTSRSVSANSQATLFWDLELKRSLKASPIGGSLSGSAKVAIGQPVTYVYAAEKSVVGILDGLRSGRTFVSESTSGPILGFSADSRKDGIIDAGMGEVIPVDMEADFYVVVRNAQGKKVEVLLDGSPIVSRTIEDKNYAFRFPHTPDRNCSYRLQVIDKPSKKGFGPVNVLAMSSPIYAVEIFYVDPDLEVEDAVIKIESRLPPLRTKGVKKTESTVRVHIDKDAYRRSEPTPWTPPKEAIGREATPDWVY